MALSLPTIFVCLFKIVSSVSSLFLHFSNGFELNYGLYLVEPVTECYPGSVGLGGSLDRFFLNTIRKIPVFCSGLHLFELRAHKKNEIFFW